MDFRQTFTIDLRDLYGKKLDAAAAKTDKQTAKINKNLGSVSTSAKSTQKKVDDLSKSISNLDKGKTVKIKVDDKEVTEATRKIKALEKSSGSSGGGIGMIAGLGLAGLATAAIAATIGTVVSSAKAYMNYEAQKTSFGVLAGDNSVGEGLANRLNKFQQDTILGPEVFKSAQTLMAFGISAKEVEKDIKELGNVSMGNAERFQSLTLAFAQTRSAGKLMGQDLLQYINAGFNPLQVMSEKWKEFGFTSKKSVGDLRKEMEKGSITADMVAKAFEMATGKGGKFDGMLDKIGKTSFGIWQNLEGQVQGLEIAAGERFKDTIKGAGMVLSALVGKVKSWVDIPLDEKLRTEADDLRVLKSELNDTNVSADRRKEILKEINDHYGQYLKGLDLEKASYQQISQALEQVVNLLDKKAEKAFLDKVLETSRNDLADLFTRKTALYRDIRETALKNGAQDLLNMTGITEEERVALIHQRLKGRDQYGNDILSPEQEASFKWYADAQKDIKKQTAESAKTESDVRKQMQQEGLLGINNSDVTGGNNGTGPGKGGGTSSGFDTAGINSVNGGSSVKNIYISIGNLVNGGVNVHTATLREGVSKAKDMIIEGLLTAVNDANLAGGNN